MKTRSKMSSFQQVKVLLLVLLALAAVSGSRAQQEEHNRVGFELPTINFTRIYNEVPLINFSRLYSRLFNITREKPEGKPQPEVAEVFTQRQHSAPPQLQLPLSLGSVHSPVEAADDSRQVINVQIPSGANGQQLFGQSYSYGQGLGYGYGFPNYAQVYAPSRYNKIPGVQVLQVYPYGLGRPNYYNYVDLSTDRIRQGYRDRGYLLQNGGFDGGRGQLYADLAPYFQWLQQRAQRAQRQQLLQAQSALAFDEGYGDYEEEGVSFADDFDGQGDDYGIDDDADYEAEELWRKANLDAKVKTKSKGNKLKARRGKQQKRVAERTIY